MPKKVKYDDDYARYTPKELKQHKDDTFKYFKQHNGEVSVKVLSRVGKVPQKVVRKWMADEKWADQISPPLSPKTQEAMQSLAEKHGLSEKEESFCYHYLNSYNATNAAIKAGYSPTTCYQDACRILAKTKVKAFVKELKDLRNAELMVDSMDVMREYMRIAFADMSDYAKFGPSGVRLVNSAQVDGRLVTEVKEGRDGVTLKLADKMKALEKLSKFLDVFIEDKVKRELLQEQLKQMKEGKSGNNNGILMELIGGLKNG